MPRRYKVSKYSKKILENSVLRALQDVQDSFFHESDQAGQEGV